MSDPEDVEEYERAHDETLLADMEIADPAPALVVDISDDDPDEDPEEETEVETEIATPEQAPTPPPAPVSPAPAESDAEMDPILDGMLATPVDSPPPPPILVVALAEHDWVVGQYATALTAAEAQVAELRYQLTAERQMRTWAQGGRVDRSTRRMRGTMRRIEQRALGRIRRLSPLRGPVSRSDVIRVVTDAMRRAREATRISER